MVYRMSGPGRPGVGVPQRYPGIMLRRALARRAGFFAQDGIMRHFTRCSAVLLAGAAYAASAFPLTLPEDGAATGTGECREIAGQASIDGQLQLIQGLACLQSDGTWQIVQGEYGAVATVPPSPDSYPGGYPEGYSGTYPGGSSGGYPGGYPDTVAPYAPPPGYVYGYPAPLVLGPPIAVGAAFFFFDRAHHRHRLDRVFIRHPGVGGGGFRHGGGQHVGGGMNGRMNGGGRMHHR